MWVEHQPLMALEQNPSCEGGRQLCAPAFLIIGVNGGARHTHPLGHPIHAFDQHFVVPTAPGTALGSGNVAVNTTDKNPHLNVCVHGVVLSRGCYESWVIVSTVGDP